MYVAGVDEAGRGPLAGPVVAAAVILGPQPIAGLGDSKARSARQRDELYRRIMITARAVGVGLAEAWEIDVLNIHHASLLAMQRAVAALDPCADEILVDGKFTPHSSCPARAVVGGDASVPAISAASIIAKVHRDRIMETLNVVYPGYGFDRHKGYPTADHLRALAETGVCAAHRRSFAPVRRALAKAGTVR